MPKFSDIAKGIAAETRTKFRHAGVDLEVALRPMSAMQEVDVESSAIRETKKRGGETEPGKAIFDVQRMVQTLAATVIDPETKERFFDGGADQVLELDTDTIAILYEQQQMWQEQCSPTYRARTPTHLFEMAQKLAEDEHDPLAFVRLSPQTRVTLARFMAALLKSARVFRPSDSSNSAPPAFASSTMPESAEPTKTNAANINAKMS